MQRTLISLDSDDKAWLDHEARARNVPMTELVRQAVHLFRMRAQSEERGDLQAALRQTAGIWSNDDGLVWQTRLRGEWNERE